MCCIPSYKFVWLFFFLGEAADNGPEKKISHIVFQHHIDGEGTKSQFASFRTSCRVVTIWPSRLSSEEHWMESCSERVAPLDGSNVTFGGFIVLYEGWTLEVRLFLSSRFGVHLLTTEEHYCWYFTFFFPVVLQRRSPRTTPSSFTNCSPSTSRENLSGWRSIQQTGMFQR